MTGTISPSASVLEAVRGPGVDNPSAFLGASSGNSVFTAPGHRGVVVYRTAGAYLVQFGGVFAPAEEQDGLLAAFVEFAAEQGRSIVSIQLQRADAERYARNGFTVNQVGASYAVDLAHFTLAGTKFMRLRNKISRAHRAGLVVREVQPEQWYDRMRQLDQVWLRSKGEHTRELQFLVGEYGGEMQAHRRLFVGTIDDELVGYISYSPVYGSRPGWMHDLSRRQPSETPGLMEAINKTAIDTFRAEGVAWLHFGFTPFTGLDDVLELPGHSVAFNRFMHLLWTYGEQVYPAQSQLSYKEKWAPDVVLPEYLAFQGPASVAGFAHVFRACGAF
ncbi:bifunctional lysylphosphatidylglycerol flippase/synthetase MprF [Micromonospora siamensis]|uniref:Uncharacterized conserved protein n=1 Tax=Micromonospora siamensis TaxID=299152 RepID=A0A1C5HUF4_9ACTN|nr:DUF2156 domain-containing protein [Micromonospora siamensis]SCG49640.1 Uncharacterized conserved protein [Micromonospora siamensis]